MEVHLLIWMISIWADMESIWTLPTMKHVCAKEQLATTNKWIVSSI